MKKNLNQIDDDDLIKIDEMNENAIELLRKEGYQSEDEIEEYLTQDIMDVRNDFKFNKIENEVKRKFVLHKHIQ